MKYIMAGYSAFKSQMDISLDECPEIATPEMVNAFLLNKGLKFLFSYGDITRSKRTYLNDMMVTDSFAAKIFDRSGVGRCMRNCKMVADSGGYQIQKNKIRKGELKQYGDNYYNYFLKKYDRQLDEYFILDIMPPNSGYFQDDEDMERYCRRSYSDAATLPAEMRKKMIYIHHFGTKPQHEIYSNLLTELHDQFNIYACGGISKLKVGMRVTPFTLSICEILNCKINAGTPKFRIHILGEGGFASILLFRLIEIHVKRTYGIDVEITYDSTTIQNTLMHGKMAYSTDEANKRVIQLDIRSDMVDSIMGAGKTRREYLYCLYNSFLVKYGMNELDPDLHPVYDNAAKRDIVGHIRCDGQFGKGIHIPAYLHGIEVYDTIERWCREEAPGIYESYITRTMTYPFVDRVADFIKKFSTKQAKSRSYALTFQNTLDSIGEMEKKSSETIKKLQNEVHAVCGASWVKMNFGANF